MGWFLQLPLSEGRRWRERAAGGEPDSHPWGRSWNSKVLYSSRFGDLDAGREAAIRLLYFLWWEPLFNLAWAQKRSTGLYKQRNSETGWPSGTAWPRGSNDDTRTCFFFLHLLASLSHPRPLSGSPSWWSDVSHFDWSLAEKREILFLTVNQGPLALGDMLHTCATRKHTGLECTDWHRPIRVHHVSEVNPTKPHGQEWGKGAALSVKAWTETKV